jgi:hypothetical protein
LKQFFSIPNFLLCLYMSSQRRVNQIASVTQTHSKAEDLTTDMPVLVCVESHHPIPTISCLICMGTKSVDECNLLEFWHSVTLRFVSRRATIDTSQRWIFMSFAD